MSDLEKNKFINDKSQTNYLAVTFEALTALRPLITKQNMFIEIQNNILDIFAKLTKRYKNGLFYWKEKNVARIDITGHVLNGIIYMMGV